MDNFPLGVINLTQLIYWKQFLYCFKTLGWNLEMRDLRGEILNKKPISTIYCIVFVVDIHCYVFCFFNLLMEKNG
jgi:hypothetical protein